MRIDLHVHTWHSPDSLSQPRAILEIMDRRGIDMVAITDHNAIDGALEMAALAPQRVIVGEEIATTQGEIIGLFLVAPVAPRMSPEETVAAIHGQGGVVYIPHVADYGRGSTLRATALTQILAQVDVLETFNARVLCARRNRQAVALAERTGLLQGAGSDAHRPEDVGLAWVELPAFVGSASLLSALASGRIHGRLTGLAGRLAGVRARLARGQGSAVPRR
ncbi:MAG: PHP domain-containing protein [Anaerolineae bacterium]|jgi:predicted metal-dependent phosphoesterase TrpH|nr:PHP domain-containing protein [Chloroflexota bacterium]